MVSSALGLTNLDDEIPVDSTYSLFCKRIHQYMRENNEDLLQKAFEPVTQGQVKDFDVNGKKIRMDSKLIGSNIAWFSRYEIIHFPCWLPAAEREVKIPREDQVTGMGNLPVLMGKSCPDYPFYRTNISKNVSKIEKYRSCLKIMVRKHFPNFEL